VSTVRRDSSGMPAKGARCLTWDCPRKSWAVAGMGSGLSMRARAEITGKYAGEVREGVEEGQGTDAGRGLRLPCGTRAPPERHGAERGRKVTALEESRIEPVRPNCVTPTRNGLRL